MKTISGLKLALIFTLVLVSCAGIFLSVDPDVIWAADNPTLSAKQQQVQGMGAFQRGDFEQSVIHWREAVRLYEASGKTKETIDILVQQANAYQALGQHPYSLEILDRARELALEINDQACLAAISGSQGNACLSIGAVKEAKRHLDESIAIARETGTIDIEASGLNNLGNLLTLQQEYGEALDAYDKSINLSRETGNQALFVKTLINAARAAVQWRNPREMETYLELALTQVRKLENSYDKAHGLVALGQMAREIASEFTRSSGRWRQLAYQALTEAANIAEILGNPHVESYALGYLGQLYENENRNDEALYLTRRAIFAAQQANAREIIYQWQWQTGRLLRAKGDIDGAIAAYQHAVTNLQTVRQDLSTTCQSGDITFRKKVGQIFLELADLLFKRTETQTDPIVVQAGLQEARDTIEVLRKTELCDYFQDACVTAMQKKEVQLDHLGHIEGHTATIYPIIFHDRLELLINLPDETIHRFTVKIDSSELEQEVRNFRNALEKCDAYKLCAQRLYAWLIKPLEGELTARKINTLVFIPDDFLRTIPMAALYDGDCFLIDKYAVAIMPGRLSMTKSNAVKLEYARPLLAGLTKSVQGNPSLPKVAEELKTIQGLYGGKQLLDENFNIRNLEQELKKIPYTIVHMATHGKFQENVRESCLWTYDGKLTMDDLETLVGLSRFRENPVELLILSACETAAGDDRAALGLAGVAVKAGARSALASLWFVGDEVAALLVPEFYRQLKTPGISKAEALRQAQLKMLNHEHYRHPGFWSAFLLTGSWL
ncbi:CHAT domain-containing protein [Desulfobacter sp. UBA2225]|uniref:CHAT domain-containing protein n=1 Tax=Desulfobacter sp. UBA2225 TaxID=1961413 RepID=UPI00257DF3D8|nr:CHAT domain-containing protein [Desulfobacter sp. UBA2225]